MTFLVGDVVFARHGKPALVVGKESETGRLFLDESRAAVQEAGRHGIKNGLAQEVKEEFHAVLDAVKDSDARREIDALFAKVQEMRKNGADPRLVRYLDGELQYRMARDRYHPREVSVDPNSVGL